MVVGSTNGVAASHTPTNSTEPSDGNATVLGFPQTKAASLPGPPWARSSLQAAIDALAWVVALVIAEILRFDLNIARVLWLPMLVLVVITIVLQVASGLAFRLYQRRYSYGTFEEARAVALAALVVAVLITLPVAIAGWPRGVPRSVTVLAFPIALLIMLCVRYLLRLWGESTKEHQPADPAIVFGAGEVASSLVHRMLIDSVSPYIPVGLLDDDPLKRNVRVRNVDVLGTLEDLPRVAKETGARAVVVAIGNTSPQLLQRVAELADGCNVDVKVLPSLTDMLASADSPVNLRNLTVEDIIGRRQVDTDVQAVGGYLTGKRVLVTGAGGSIGSELCVQIAQFTPAELIMLDHDETNLQDVEVKVCGNGLLTTPEVVLADIRDAEALTAIFEQRRPEVVFHAAALKHLPMLEQYPQEGWKTNVQGSLNVLRAAQAVGVATYVNISTDKAADPTSVLGTTKRLAERLTAWMAEQTGHKYVSVRFGNVLGSRGSMLPLFRTLIEQGKPITITDPEVERYFMAIPEACQLVLQAGGIGRPGEVMILDMGKPVKILDIAKRLIAASGKPVTIDITGLRPGEKLSEDLVSQDETAERPFHPMISHAKVESLSVNDLNPAEWPDALAGRAVQSSVGRLLVGSGAK